MTVYLGCYTPDRGEGAGIVAARFADGVLTQIGSPAPAMSPSFLALHPSLPVLYGVGEAAAGELAAWSIAADGTLAPLPRVALSKADPCHLTVDESGSYLVAVSYSGASVSVHRLGPSGEIAERTDLVHHTRHGAHPRQESAHPHMVKSTSDGLLVTDLGGDAIYRYAVDDGRLIESAPPIDAPPGSGPRHLVAAGEHWYLTAELDSTVLVYDRGWELTGQEKTTRAQGECLPSELAASRDGRFLYVANRGPDTVAVFALDDGHPRYVTEVGVGKWPRHIAVHGEFLFVANQDSHEVTVMRIEPETAIPSPVSVFATPSPTCVLVRA